MKSWDIYIPTHRGLKYFDTVYYNDDCPAEFIKNSLINHDGYPCNIILRECLSGNFEK